MMHADQRHARTGGRRASRRRALEVLYAADLRNDDPRRWLTPDDVDGFTRRLVEGVAQHLDDIDELLGDTSRGWPVRRMAVVDRNLLRLAAYEMLHEDTPPAVVISEAVELATILSTERSPKFVNGVLSAIHRMSEQDDPPPADGDGDA